ncbi:MAG: RecX family transcriptional regulator [Acidobacteria bacterium]|nr:RecX family transcriptional regulator [Acidobacteriota bacterium]
MTRPPAAYVEGLKMLARRELSEAQVRQRLARRGHEAGEIEAAVERLRAERAIDDRRVAEAIARLETATHGRGRLRVRLRIEQAGVDRALARQATDAAFAALDDEALLEAALQKRLRGRTRVTDEGELHRLHRFLLAQGFEADRVRQRIERLRR